VHPDDSGGITTVAMEDVAQDVQIGASDQVASGIVKTGSYTFDVTSPSAGDLTGQDGTVYKFGAVSLTGCFDTTGMSAVNADGTPAASTDKPREAMNMIVIYLAAEKHWIVNKFFTATADAAPC
jgi:hypothetical protein